MSTWKFTGPGGLNDFSDPKNWHDAMLKEAEDIVQILVEAVLGRPAANQAEFDQVAAALAYINPAVNEPPIAAKIVALTPWSAFPRAVKVKAPWSGFPADHIDPDGSYRAADQVGAEDYRPGVFVDRRDNVLHLPSRHRQDEYCEWVLRRDGAGRIRKAIFVAEGYDYFSKLYEVDEQRVVEIYRNFTGTSTINADDLRAPEGIYFRDLNGRTSEQTRSNTTEPFSGSSASTDGAFGEFTSRRRPLRVFLKGTWSRCSLLFGADFGLESWLPLRLLQRLAYARNGITLRIKLRCPCESS